MLSTPATGALPAPGAAFRREARVAGADWVGWASSAILVATIGKQVHKQWSEGRSEGVSRWLFAGQIAASVGFVVYSALVSNWVFVVTNALILCDAIAGLLIVRLHRRRARARVAPAGT